MYSNDFVSVIFRMTNVFLLQTLQFFRGLAVELIFKFELSRKNHGRYMSKVSSIHDGSRNQEVLSSIVCIIKEAVGAASPKMSSTYNGIKFPSKCKVEQCSSLLYSNQKLDEHQTDRILMKSLESGPNLLWKPSQNRERTPAWSKSSIQTLISPSSRPKMPGSRF